jgi:hypothetical protein
MAKYRIVIECDNIDTRSTWWFLLDAYMEYLERTGHDLFDQESWTIAKDWVEE